MPAKPLTNLRWITFSNVSTGVLSAMASTVCTEGKIPPGVALLSVIMRAIRQCLIAQEMNLQTGCIKAYASAVGKQITSKLGELAMEEAAQQWRFKDDVDAMVDKMQDLEAMLHDADDRLRRGGMDREVVGRSICSALHWPLDLHRHKNRLAHRAEVSVCVQQLQRDEKERSVLLLSSREMVLHALLS